MVSKISQGVFVATIKQYIHCHQHIALAVMVLDVRGELAVRKMKVVSPQRNSLQLYHRHLVSVVSERTTPDCDILLLLVCVRACSRLGEPVVLQNVTEIESL